LKKRSDFSRLMGYAGNYRYFTYASWVLSAVSALVELVPFVYIWKILRDVLNAAPNYAQAVNIPHYGWMAVLFAVLSYLIYIAALMCSHLSAFRVATNLRLAVSEHLAVLPLGFAETFGSGKLRKIIHESTGAAETYLAHQLPDQYNAIATPVGLLVLLLAFDWRLGLLSLAPVVLAFLIMATMTGKRMAEKMRQYGNALEAMSNEAVEYVRGIPVVKTFGQSVFSFKKFKTTIDEYEKWVISYTKDLRLPMMFYTAAVNRLAFLRLRLRTCHRCFPAAHDTQAIQHFAQAGGIFRLCPRLIVKERFSLACSSGITNRMNRKSVERGVNRQPGEIPLGAAVEQPVVVVGRAPRGIVRIGNIKTQIAAHDTAAGILYDDQFMVDRGKTRFAVLVDPITKIAELAPDRHIGTGKHFPGRDRRQRPVGHISPERQRPLFTPGSGRCRNTLEITACLGHGHSFRISGLRGIIRRMIGTGRKGIQDNSTSCGNQIGSFFHRLWFQGFRRDVSCFKINKYLRHPKNFGYPYGY
jgi:hypothetical protein